MTDKCPVTDCAICKHEREMASESDKAIAETVREHEGHTKGGYQRPETVIIDDLETYLSVLQEADKLVHGDRNMAYGHPLDDFKRTAKMVNAMLGIELRPHHIGMIMCCVKLSRQMNHAKRDNMVDLAGYAETVEWCLDEESRRGVVANSFGRMSDV